MTDELLARAEALDAADPLAPMRDRFLAADISHDTAHGTNSVLS